MRVLREDNSVASYNVQKGISIAPYFYGEYGYTEENVAIESFGEVYPVEVELFTQKEYNDRIREVILSYCPGCQRYKPISNRVQSLNGHFEEISLDSVCFYRQNTKPAPRVFRKDLFFLGGFWRHFDPAGFEEQKTLEEIKSHLRIKYDPAGSSGGETAALEVSFAPDFFVQLLSEVLKNYIENALTFTRLKFKFDRPLRIDKDAFESQISPENRESFRKNCKKYGVALAVMTYDPAFEDQIARSLKPLIRHFFAAFVHRESGKSYLALLDSCGFLKSLHFRSPLLQAAGTKVAVYDQFGESRYLISFEMEQV
ncbi:MAG: hypothetical protein IJV00_06740 [Clostridia bacterium]|nr:hypothetical protein [Clostridia bacterium]